MKTYSCDKCGYITERKSNYSRHLDSQGHKLNILRSYNTTQFASLSYTPSTGPIPSIGNTQATPRQHHVRAEMKCPNCNKLFINRTSYSRHINHRCPMKGKISVQGQNNIGHPIGSEHNLGFTQSTNVNNIGMMNYAENCVNLGDSNLTGKLIGLVTHLVDEVKELKKTAQNVHNQTTQIGTLNNFKDCKLISINYLNQTFPNMISIETYKKNLKTTHRLSQEDAETLSGSFSLGFNQFADEFIRFLGDNCHRQICDTGVVMENDEMNGRRMLPVITTDSNLRTHNEKTQTGWEKTGSIQNLKDIFNICNDQIYVRTEKPIILNDKQKYLLYNRIRKSNFLQPNQSDENLDILDGQPTQLDDTLLSDRNNNLDDINSEDAILENEFNETDSIASNAVEYDEKMIEDIRGNEFEILRKKYEEKYGQYRGLDPKIRKMVLGHKSPSNLEVRD